MNGEQRNQSLQNGSYKMVVEDGKVTVTPEQSQQQSEEEKALIQRLREKIGTKVNDLSFLGDDYNGMDRRTTISN